MKKTCHFILITVLFLALLQSPVPGKEGIRDWNEIHAEMARKNAQNAFERGSRQFNDANYESARLSFQSVINHIRELESYNRKTSGDNLLEEMA
ncbi:MAG: hypothetical protein J7M18_04895, partial [Candidatus Eremiobacteraeota bacterium]|nr:hypothetical protein [Candidatus Eremiobacteraeota bacterium]